MLSQEKESLRGRADRQTEPSTLSGAALRQTLASFGSDDSFSLSTASVWGKNFQPHFVKKKKVKTPPVPLSTHASVQGKGLFLTNVIQMDGIGRQRGLTGVEQSGLAGDKPELKYRVCHCVTWSQFWAPNLKDEWRMKIPTSWVVTRLGKTLTNRLTLYVS